MFDDLIKKIQEFSSSDALYADVNDILNGRIPLNTLDERLCKEGQKDPELVKYFVKQGFDDASLNSTMNLVCYALKLGAGGKSSWQKEIMQRLEQQQSQISLLEKRIKDIEQLIQEKNNKGTNDYSHNYADTEHNYDCIGVIKNEQDIL